MLDRRCVNSSKLGSKIGPTAYSSILPSNATHTLLTKINWQSTDCPPHTSELCDIRVSISILVRKCSASRSFDRPSRIYARQALAHGQRLFVPPPSRFSISNQRTWLYSYLTRCACRNIVGHVDHQYRLLDSVFLRRLQAHLALRLETLLAPKIVESPVASSCCQRSLARSFLRVKCLE